MPKNGDRLAGLSPKVRALCENYIRTASPERKYHDLVNDCYPLPGLPREPLKIDSKNDLLTVMQDAYRVEIESGRKQMELRQLFERLREGVAK
ncbi:hypothetical protein SAMN04488075_2332 [Paracoccus alkenifer]|uniref:Uncharacterized protein n=2 Tax=Paracoccus alkenifer TaxID=65735 RepID=A0A1H6MX39_9RHOB|nr:hypothetical protein SAMN04488075_2332 [Paracoccus alkenifer]